MQEQENNDNGFYKEQDDASSFAPVEVDPDEKFFNTMDAELNREVKFDEDTMSALTGKFEGMSAEYAQGDKNKQALLEADVVQTGDRMFKAEEFRKNLAGLCNKNEIGDNPTKKLVEYAADIENIVNGNNEVLYKENTPGYELHDGWKSFDEIEQLVTSRYVDEQSKNILNTYINDQRLLAENVQVGEYSKFNWDKNYNKVYNHIIETGDIRSLATDKIFGNRVFEDDLMSAIEMGTYADLGISDDLSKYDPTPFDNNITSDDAAMMTSKILQDDDLLKKYLAEYYTKAMEQNY